MNASAIFLPMGILALSTIAIVTVAAVARASAIQRRTVEEDFYKLFEGPGRPAFEAQLSRHYANLLELPVLYYAAGLSIFAAGLVDQTFLILFWAYVAARGVHAAIHITYNRVIHRAAAFGIGCTILAVVWARFLYLVGGD